MNSAIKVALKARKFVAYGRELARRETWTREQLEEFQWRRALETVRFCHDHVPFYQKRWAEHGIRIDQIQSPEDFRALPYTTKPDLKDFPDEFVPAGLSSLNRHVLRTGGSPAECPQCCASRGA